MGRDDRRRGQLGGAGRARPRRAVRELTARAPFANTEAQAIERADRLRLAGSGAAERIVAVLTAATRLVPGRDRSPELTAASRAGPSA